MKISTIVTCYESVSTIGLTIASLCAQQHQPEEIIVTDDGSSEKTCAYVEDLLKTVVKHFPIKTQFITHERTKPYRLNTVRNAGISAASGDLIFLVDGDIIVPEATLEEHYQIHNTLASSNKSAYVFCVTKKLLGNGTVTEGRVSEWGHKLDRFLMSKAWHELDLEPNQTLSLASFRRQDWSHVGGFDSDFDGHWGFDEVEFAHRIKAKGTILTCHGIAYHIDHGPGAGNRDYKRNQKLYIRKCKK